MEQSIIMEKNVEQLKKKFYAKYTIDGKTLAVSSIDDVWNFIETNCLKNDSLAQADGERLMKEKLILWDFFCKR